MAKVNKNRLTIEDAMVPDKNQPFRIPNNWNWVFAKSIFDIVVGATPSTSHKEFYENGSIAWLPSGCCQDCEVNKDETTYKLITEEAYNSCSTKMMIPDTVMIALTGATAGKVGYLNFEACGNQSIVGLLPNRKVVPKFIFYQLLYRRGEILSACNGSAQPHISKEYVSNMAIALPPFPEQQRIVEQIESLFTKLDEAKEKAESVVETYETNCASVLKMAFNGELSKEWRSINNLDMDSWRIRSFDECILKMQNGLAKRSGDNGELFGVLRLANLGEDDISTEDLREIRLTEKEQNAYKLNSNDVVMIRVNGSRENVGRQLLIHEDNNWAFCDHIIRIRFVEDIIPEYMVMFSKTDEYRNYIEKHMVSSAGQNTISRKGLSDLSIPIPRCEEQKTIIGIVHSMIEKEKAVKDKVDSVITEIDLMKKSILAKAFRGELGTNDPLEESSEVLLKKIMEV